RLCSRLRPSRRNARARTSVPSETEAQPTADFPRPSLFRRLVRWLGLGTIPLPELRAKYETPASRYVVVDGTRVHYRIEGEGPTLILLHGMLAQLQTWDGWVEQLRAHYRIVRLDVPGFGLTGPMVRGNYTPEYVVEFFEKIRQALGEERFHLVGNSLGGFLSWYYAATHPQHVERVILIDPLSYPQRMPLLMRFSILPVIRWFASFWVPRTFIAEGVRQVYGDPRRYTTETVDRYHDLLLREGNRGAMLKIFSAATQYFPLGVEHGPWDRIKDIRAKVLLMWGQNDRWLPVSHVERWRADLPGIEVKIYPDAGHIPMEELPEQSAADAHAFLSAR
ncbi:MAG TPA: alpha/beta hydrolase, partial [Polyangiales bacterium]